MTAAHDADDAMILPDAPAIPGLRFRRFRGAADYAPMVVLINADHEASGSTERITVEEHARRYNDLKNSDPTQDLLMIEIADHLVGYSRVMWWEEAVAPETASESA